jgi:hypothetical protein
VTLLALFIGPGGPWAIAYLGVLEDSRYKTVVGQVGWDERLAESIPSFFQNCREVGILMEGEVGDIPGSVKDSTKDWIGRFGCVRYWKVWLNPIVLCRMSK